MGLGRKSDVFIRVAAKQLQPFPRGQSLVDGLFFISLYVAARLELPKMGTPTAFVNR